MTADFPILHIPEQRRAARLSLWLAVALLGLAAWVSVPAWTWAIWMPAAAALALSIHSCTPVQAVMGDGHLTWCCGRLSGRVPQKQIAYVEFRRLMDAPPACSLVLRDGRCVPLPAPCVPDPAGFAKRLQAAGIAVRQA